MRQTEKHSEMEGFESENRTRIFMYNKMDPKIPANNQANENYRKN